MFKYRLGTIEASEALLKDLYIDLRAKVNAWSEITQQTPQARMGYIGQHLVSVVTGYPGGKSGARGYDLIISPTEYGEIKTCYRVDQLGTCKACKAVVSSLESVCAACGSTEIDRKDDSKWLISIRNDAEFANILKPSVYYFVLFEYSDLSNTVQSDIIASIWEVDPKTKGFAYCMIDYYLNIRSKSQSKAPFDMWPYMIKFALTNPKLIYRSIISPNGEVRTEVFPTLGNAYYDEMKQLSNYARSQTITVDHLKRIIKRFDSSASISKLSKRVLLERIEDIQQKKKISNATLCDVFSEEVYLPEIISQKDRIPDVIKRMYDDFAD